MLGSTLLWGLGSALSWHSYKNQIRWHRSPTLAFYPVALSAYLLFNKITSPSHCRFLFSHFYLLIHLQSLLGFFWVYTDLFLIYRFIPTYLFIDVAFSWILKLHSVASSIRWIQGFAIETIEYRNKSYYLTESTNTWIYYPSELNKWLEDKKSIGRSKTFLWVQWPS